jgi:putative phosphoribosyl transferase
MERYRDRVTAGRALARRIGAVSGDVLVLGLPRGGVPVAAEVARALGAPMDVLVVRKLGVPGHAELAMGAVASGGVQVLNDAIIEGLGIAPDTVEAIRSVERRQVEVRERLFRGSRPPLDLHGTTAILVDDGIATGATMRAAVAVARAAGAARVIVAAPVAAQDIVRQLRREADVVVVPYQPEPFVAVGYWYDDFSEVQDGTVRRLIAEFPARVREPA